MRKIAIKLRDRTGRAAGRGRAARDHEEVSRTHTANGWLPQRQLPFRWKCDGCRLFCMIKYRRKKRLGKPDPPPCPAGAAIRIAARARERKKESVRQPVEKSLHVAPRERYYPSSLGKACNARKKTHVSEKLVATSKEREGLRDNEQLLSSLSFSLILSL